jgi:hypothetical protein
LISFRQCHWRPQFSSDNQPDHVDGPPQNQAQHKRAQEAGEVLQAFSHSGTEFNKYLIIILSGFGYLCQ